jgi:hypothetical protein
MSPEKCFDTLPVQSWGTAQGYDRDPLYRTLKGRRERFLGCPRGSDEGDCRDPGLAHGEQRRAPGGG